MVHSFLKHAIRWLAVFGAAVPVISHAADVSAPAPEGREIMERCNSKYPGEDQRSRLTIILRDKDGNEKKNVYRRLWKDFRGVDGVADKMMLFTEFPPDAQGAGFMRWGYTAVSGRIADQWVYLPVLKKIRRVSIRDPGDSFLGSDLTYADISERGLDADQHRLIRAMPNGNEQIYAVESMPVNKGGALYSKTVSWFTKGQDWDGCMKRQVDYYDKKGEPIKQQLIKWQRVDKAWVWDEVTVRNVQTGHSSVFQVTDVKVNVGLSDDEFTERALKTSQ